MDNYLIANAELQNILDKAEKDLLQGKKIKFVKSKPWRVENIPDYPGVYALFEDERVLLYIGETGSLMERMSDICRTVNHSFRKQLGHNRFGAVKGKKKYDDATEALLDLFFVNNLYVSFIKANFGRTEIEEHLVEKYQKTLLNSEKKRKLKIKLDKLPDHFK